MAPCAAACARSAASRAVTHWAVAAWTFPEGVTVDRLQIVAIAAAVALLAVSYLFRPPPAPPSATPTHREAAEAPQATASGATPTAPELPASESTGPAASEAKIVTLENDAVRIRVSNLGARLESVELLGYRATVARDSGPVELVTAELRAVRSSVSGSRSRCVRSRRPATRSSLQDRDRVELRAKSGGVVVTRHLELDDAGYGGRLSVSIRERERCDAGAEARSRALRTGAADHRPRSFPELQPASRRWTARFAVRPSRASVRLAFWRLSVGPPLPEPRIRRRWSGSGSTASTSCSRPCPQFRATARLSLARSVAIWANPQLGVARLEVPAGTGVERSYRLFLGPKVPEIVSAVDPRLETRSTPGGRWCDRSSTSSKPCSGGPMTTSSRTTAWRSSS